MPLFEVLVIDVGASIAKALLKRWLGSTGPVTDTAIGIVDVLKSRTGDRIVLRQAQRQFETIGERVGESLLPIFEMEDAMLDEGTRTSIALAVAETLNAATSEVIAKQNFEPIEIAKQLLRTHPAESYSFSEIEGNLYERIISESCNYIVDIASQLPQFTERTLAEILKREGQMIAIAEKILQEVARMRAESDPRVEAARFELEYRRSVVRHLDELELFGRGVSISERKYSLSLAYVTLSLEQKENSITAFRKNGMDDFTKGKVPEAEIVKRITSVNEALAEVMYPSLRVECIERKIQSMGNVPSVGFGPASMKPLNLQIQSGMGTSNTAKGDRLTKFSAEFPIGAFKQRSGPYPFPRHGIKLIKDEGVLKISFKGSNGIWRLRTPPV